LSPLRSQPTWEPRESEWGALNLNTGLFPAGSPLAVGSLTFTGGTLTGSDSLMITTFNWSSGVLSGNGSTVVTNGGNLNFTGNDTLFLDSRSLVNNGTATWNRGNSFSYLYFSNHALFTNSGSFTIQNSGLYVFLGVGTFLNSGSFLKSNPDQVDISGIVFTNDGSTAANNGFFESSSPPGPRAMEAIRFLPAQN